MRLVVLLALSSFALAAQAAPRASHAKRAKALYDAGEYRAAVTQYQAAYDEDGQSKWLFDIAQSFRLADDPTQAMEFYRRYLAVSPKGVGAVDAREYLRKLEQAQPAPAEAPEPRTTEPEPRTTEPEPRTTEPEPRTTEPFTPTPFTPARAPRQRPRGDQVARARPTPQLPYRSGPAPQPGRGYRLWGTTLSLIGTGGLVVAYYYAKAAGAKSDAIRQLRPGEDAWDPSLESAGRNDVKLAWLAGGLGGAALITGFILYYGGKHADTVAAEVYAAPRPDGATLGVVRRF